MKRLLYILAAILTLISCNKNETSKAETYTFDKVTESSAAINPDNTYLLGISFAKDKYSLTINVKSENPSLTSGTYQIGTDGCKVVFNDGYANRGMNSGTIEVASGNGIYTINITASNRTAEYNFRYEGSIVFNGTVKRDCTVGSTAMGMSMKYSIYLPGSYEAGESFPVLYLLHGYGDENNAWIDKGLLVKAATEYEKNGGKPMIVVCPDALTTFYYDSYQTKYKTYFFEELVPAIEKTYKVKTDKYSRAVAGLSMGGYGTLYYGLGEPDKFCYAYACSAAIEMQGMPSLTDLARKADPNQLPGITLEMGTEDWVTGDGKDFHNTLNSLGIKHEYIARSGVHDWKFWQECLPKILKRCGETFK